MNARTFAIIGMRLLAALSFIRTINAISLWIAEKNIAIGYKAEIFGASYVMTVIGLCALPFLVGVAIWFYAPKLADYFCKDTIEATNTRLASDPDFLTMGLVAIGVLVLVNALPTLLFDLFQVLFVHHGAQTVSWNIMVIPAIKIAMCMYVILRANKLSKLFFNH